ncbi:MAG: polysaccharide biosynthesis protein [Devosia sp. 67-54]|uniref:polysaccharide biosynthesis protein n=1 Tax=unclassified Devosia TaxID=196773 RepID=UPI0009696790|nr:MULTISPECIES: nucleoside-diphosphate sugar epimerase/dehydratase [unclassified Devosia]MBN9307609.1 polysaccharide biosynthesis protein [Devosia sp.]OJX19968.1 MAG: polysaccharide biosynthesis protein [Devosia sp. 67-54]
MLEQFRDRLNRVPRRWKSLILVAFDAVALIAVLWLSYQLRLGGTFQPTPAQWVLILLAPAVALPIFLRLGLYRAVIRYLPERAIWTMVGAMLLATIAWVFVLFIAEVTRMAVLPRTVPIFYFLLGTIVVSGSRFAAKYILYPARGGPAGRPIVVYGAGDAGRQLAATLSGQGDAYVVAFLDDDRNLQGRDVSGIRVHAPASLPTLITDFGVKEIVLSMASLEPARRQAIYTELSRFPVKVRTLPSLREIASGKYQVNQLREIDIDDLLGRSSVPADPELLQQMIAGRTILVSGGGGSIGSELCRIIARLEPKALVILEANEFALYQIERALSRDPALRVVPVLGSVTDEALVRRTLREQGVEVVFHAAAHKHVPLLEANVLEGVRNNVFGTRTLVRCAFEAGVRDFVLISSDKAVRPTNVMGATKRWAELVTRQFGDRAAAERDGQRFSAVRFGNVLGSNGSVVPLFREQIANGGPVTLTDERMTRYFMSIHEAAELIVQAGALSEGGDIFLLEMGQPVKIRDLAENMIRLAGLSLRTPQEPAGDVEISVTGIRPGEKLYEELFYDETQATRTKQPKILRAKMARRSNFDLDAALAQLQAAMDAADEAEVRRILFDVIEQSAS